MEILMKLINIFLVGVLAFIFPVAGCGYRVARRGDVAVHVQDVSGLPIPAVDVSVNPIGPYFHAEHAGKQTKMATLFCTLVSAAAALERSWVI